MPELTQLGNDGAGIQTQAGCTVVLMHTHQAPASHLPPIPDPLCRDSEVRSPAQIHGVKCQLPLSHCVTLGKCQASLSLSFFTYKMGGRTYDLDRM